MKSFNEFAKNARIDEYNGSNLKQEKVNSNNTISLEMVEEMTEKSTSFGFTITDSDEVFDDGKSNPMIHMSLQTGSDTFGWHLDKKQWNTFISTITNFGKKFKM